MTYNEKKSLYESIMKDVAKTVKRKLNETDNNPNMFSDISDRELEVILKKIQAELKIRKDKTSKTDKKDLKKFCKLLCVPAYTYGESFGDMMRGEKEISDAFKKYLLANDEDFYEKMVDFGYNNAPGYVEEDNDDKAFTEALKCAGCDNYYGNLDEKIMLHFVDFLLVDKKIKEQFVNDIQESINELINGGNIEDIYELFKTQSDLTDTFEKFKRA